MKRIYACFAIVAALLATAFYSSFQVQRFADDISTDLDCAIEAIRNSDLRTADGHLEQNAPEEAFGELRRAQVRVETLQWLARRFV